MALRVPLIVLVCGCGVASTPSPRAAQRLDTEVLRDGDFELAPWDSGMRRRSCFARAPWGPSSWGVEAATFSDPSNHALDAARFNLVDGVAHLYGRESAGRWGFVRYVQGDVWGASNCGPVPWNRGTSLELTKDATIALRVYREKSALTSKFASWLMFAVNLWFTSPAFPPGTDKQKKKPLVMDLLFHHRCNTPFCGPRHYVDEAAHHYQESVGATPHGQWVTLEIPVRRHLDAALSRFDLPTKAVELYQIEVLIELRHAEGAMRIDDFHLWL